VGEEHRACRERVALFDATSFAKFVVVGRDAERALSWICANDVTGPPGRVVYTQMLNVRGGIECDLTVTRLAEDAYYIVTGTGFATHDFAWIRRHVPEPADARLIDVTSAFAVLPLMGPRVRDLLQQVAADDVSNAALPFGGWRRIQIAGAPVRALRVTYVGELGFELHMPVECALTVYDALIAAGEPFGLAHAGYRAIESLRLEKGYRAWGADIGPDHTPLEAGLGFAVKLKSEQPFLGREALERQRAEGLKKRLACFTVDDPDVVLLGRETICRDGVPVGWLTSGGFGYTVGKAIGYGYVRNPAGVDPAWLTSGTYELEVATERVPAVLHLAPLYDPAMARVRA
jgi:4-methylaminobutanoate oxidase (formaldehyde-forming)